MTPSDHERTTELEIKFTFLEEHVHQQDREIHALRALLEKQTADLEKLRGAIGSDGMDVRGADERPPHY